MHVAPIALVDKTPRLNTDRGVAYFPPQKLIYERKKKRRDGEGDRGRGVGEERVREKELSLIHI